MATISLRIDLPDIDKEYMEVSLFEPNRTLFDKGKQIGVAKLYRRKNGNYLAEIVTDHLDLPLLRAAIKASVKETRIG